jgi:signal transduction histidine kinase/CheY-like chemotaxis protein
MTDDGKRTDSEAELRVRAENRAEPDAARSDEDLLSRSPGEGRRVLHELRVHQIELELQNEELRQAEAKLDVALARYFDLYNLAPVGYCSISATGLILEANLTAATLLHVARGALTDQPIVRFIQASDQDIYYRFHKSLVETGDPQVCELRMVRPEDPPLWVRLNATIGPGDDGAPTSRIVLIDISGRKQAETKHEESQARLNQALKMESVGRLAGGVAHDFNNMLSVIIGNAEMALETLGPDDPLHETLQEIYNAARRSAEVTGQLLAFARKQTVAPKVLRLNDTMEAMLKMLRRLIGEDIDIVWLPEGRLWSVKIDPTQLDQILANLCVNARDAIAGIGKITIKTGNVVFDEAYCAAHAGLVPGEFVQLAVSDDGCGMSRQTMSKLFEPYFTTKGVDKGTGLGLATIYGIVKQNAGFIRVHSEPGEGTTFRIYLPRHETVAAPVHEDREAAALAVPGSEIILLVEDEPAILSMTKSMLERLQYTVLTATNPGDAVRLAAAYPGRIDLLLTDVIMPEMNGRDLAKTLLIQRPHLARLFMSGYSANVIANGGGVLDSSVHFLQKPFAMKELATKVRQALGEDWAPLPDRPAVRRMPAAGAESVSGRATAPHVPSAGVDSSSSRRRRRTGR